MGPAVVRIGRPATFYVKLTNQGNVDTLPVAVSLAVPASTSIGPQRNLPVFDAYASITSGNVVSFVSPPVSGGGTTIQPITLTANGDVTLRAQAREIRISQDSSGFTGLHSGPPLFDGSLKPTQRCGTCDIEWNLYQQRLGNADSAKNDLMAAYGTLGFESSRMVRNLMAGAFATAAVAWAAPHLTAVLFPQLKLVTDKVLVEAAISSLLGQATDATKGVLLSDPELGQTLAEQAKKQALLTQAEINSVLNRNGVVISGDLAVQRSFLFAKIDIMIDALHDVLNAWPTIKGRLSEVNAARNAVRQANAKLVAAAQAYVTCAIASCNLADLGLIPPDDGDDDASYLAKGVGAFDPNDKFGLGGGRHRSLCGRVSGILIRC